jgi:hypothetical protein
MGSGYERDPKRLFYITAATDDKPIAGGRVLILRPEMDAAAG